MSWLANPLKFAGDLLDSVDRTAQDALHDDDGSTAKRRVEGRYVPRSARTQPRQAAGVAADAVGSSVAPPEVVHHHAPVAASSEVSAPPSGGVSAGIGARRLEQGGSAAHGGGGNGDSTSDDNTVGGGAGTAADPAVVQAPRYEGRTRGDAGSHTADQGGHGSGGGIVTDSSLAGGTHAALLKRLGLRDKQVESLRGQVQHLNAELDELDRQMVAAQSRLDAAAETETDLRAQLKDALAEARQARRDAERLARQTADVDVGAVERLRSDLAAAHKEAENLRGQLDTKSAHHAQALQALRREARAAEAAANDAANDCAMARAAAQRREEELLNEAGELQRALTQAQQALEQKAGDMAKLSSTSSNAEAEADLRREAAHAAEAALLAERRQNSMMRRDQRVLTETTAKLQVQLEEARRQHQALQAQHNDTVAKLEQRIESMSANVQQDRSSQLEARVRTMAESVMAKQGTIDDLRSQNSALQRRLERERAMRKEAEAVAEDMFGDRHDDGSLATSLSSRFGGSGDADSVDVEAGGGFGRSGTPNLVQRRRGLRSRMMAASPAISKLQPIAQNPKVAKAIDVVDKLTLRTGSFLSREPLARLFFLIYLVLLHLWALFILSFHTHRLDHEAGGGSSSLPLPSPPFVNSRSN